MIRNRGTEILSVEQAPDLDSLIGSGRAYTRVTRMDWRTNRAARACSHAGVSIYIET